VRRRVRRARVAPLADADKMQYRRFGRTELAMPVFSCGGMRYQHAWKDKPPEEIPPESQRNLETTIRRALELGIRHIETARGYGTSEMQLGRILPTVPRNSIIVQTKVPPFEDAAQFLKAFETSMGYLGLERLDLLAIHGVNNRSLLDWTLRPGGCLEAALRLKADGRVGHVGFSTHAPLEIILEAIASDAFEYVNLHWYYIFQSNAPAIDAARRRDMGVFIISPSDKGGHLYQPSRRLAELCAPLSPIVFNDLFCLSRPDVHTLSIGAARPEDFDEHLKALDLLAGADDLLPPIIERLEAAMVDALGADWLATWSQGLPSPDETPGRLNIGVILWLRNLVLAYGMVDYAKARYNLLGNGSHWFPGEKADKVADLDLRACLAASPHADRIPALLAETHQRLAGPEVKRLAEG